MLGAIIGDPKYATLLKTNINVKYNLVKSDSYLIH